MGRALVEEACRRSGLVWVLPAGDEARAQPVWHLWHDGAAALVHGGLEQRLTGVDDGDRVLVVCRSKERQADRVVQWWATAHRVLPGTPAWDALVPPLNAARLNPPDGTAQPARWAATSVVLRLVPDGTERTVDRS